MRRERSAGVVVYRQGDDGARQYLLLDYGRFWDYPKGHVERGEDDESAALRELAEETGIADARLEPGFARDISYFFRDKSGGLIRKEVVFFLAGTSRQRVKLSHEHEGSAWLAYEDALERLTYANAKRVLHEAERFLTSRGSGVPPDR
jgi:8-oxo-dGTP pyrophosphatase MutT (NUDIX family)